MADAVNPHNTTNQFILSKPIIAGTTSEAKETSEILAERVDNARSFE